MELKRNPDVEKVLDNYPPLAQKRIRELRDLILRTAEQIEGLAKLEETLKWGELSYLAKYGSTVRIAWKDKNPDRFSIFFKCTSLLVPTFRYLYPETFHFAGTREIFFSLKEKIPEKELAHCIELALRYHKLKGLPLLGA